MAVAGRHLSLLGYTVSNRLSQFDVLKLELKVLSLPAAGTMMMVSLSL